jgi:glycosyltransferase-like protein
VERCSAVLAAALRGAPAVDINHAQDMLAARALLALRTEGEIPHVVRTVHHTEVFEDRFLEECQRASIQDVDRSIAVSAFWADRLAHEFGVEAPVVPNGVDAARFASPGLDRAAAGARMGWGDRPVVLAVGGVQARKGSRMLLEAFARSRARLPEGALLVIAGGDGIYASDAHEVAWRDDASRLGLVVHEGPDAPTVADVARIGVVADDNMPVLYRAADVLAFPSTREGFGLVLLEAAAAGLPVVVSDLPVFSEFMEDGVDCLMVPVGDPADLANVLARVMKDPVLRDGLVARAHETAARYSWDETAARNEAVYAAFLAGG